MSQSLSAPYLCASLLLTCVINSANGDVTTLESSMYQITNSSAAVFACSILGDETSELSHVGQHARGDCTTVGSQGFSIPVANTV